MEIFLEKVENQRIFLKCYQPIRKDVQANTQKGREGDKLYPTPIQFILQEDSKMFLLNPF